jgi:hypothetical protein
MAIKVAAGVVGILFIAACAMPGSSTTCNNTSIDWVNFIQVGSTQYIAAAASPPVVLQESDLGPVYTHVKFNVSANVCDPGYRLKDGDAAFLDAGTPVYQVNGHPAGAELAARFNGSIVAYFAIPVR